MRFEELRLFLDRQMNMKHIYQPVMIKTLLAADNKATVEEIARNFLSEDRAQIDYYKNIVRNMPGRVLQNHNIVQYDKKTKSYTLKIDNITEKQKRELVDLCDEKLRDYIQKYDETIWSHRYSARKIPRSLRAAVFAKTKNVCAACGISAIERRLEVDHILPSSKGGSNDIKNLQPLCYICNREKSNRFSVDFVDWKKKMNYREPECTFCNIKDSIAETDLASASYSKYHALVTPKRHVGTFFEMIPAERSHCMELILDVKNDIKCKDGSITGFNIGFNTEDAMHCHIHVIPRRQKHDR